MTSIAVNQISAFDAATDKKINFTYSGNQCIANTLIIYNSATNAVVYENRVTSFALSHTIPAGTLTNGGAYYVKITAHYMEGSTECSVASPLSNVFLCLETPVWRFNNLMEGAVIHNAALQVTMYYEQEQNDLLDEFYIELYDYGHVLKYRSGTRYDIEEPFEISNLDDNSTYYLRAYGTTVSGLKIDTRTTYPNDLMINVDYVVPEIYSHAGLENIPDSGSVRIALNVAYVEGYSENGKEFTYIDNEYINLEDDMVVFDENVYMSDEFTFLLRGRNFKLNTDIMVIKAADNGSVVTVKLREATVSGASVYFAELRCTLQGSEIEYVLYSDFVSLDLSDNVQIMVWFKRGLFSLELSEVIE